MMTGAVTVITLTDMRFYSRHGVMEQEGLVGNDFLVSVTIELDRCVSSDDLDDTVSYADVAAVVGECMKQPSQLIEHCSYRIARDLLSAPFGDRINRLMVKVTKPTPPIAGIEMAGASVETLWKRSGTDQTDRAKLTDLPSY